MDPLLDDLDERQREAVTSTANPLAILAPAGSGKTRVLTRRIAWRVREGSADARHVLAVTFTRKAAGELVDRVASLGVEGVTAGTFHALALAQLRGQAVEQHRQPPNVLASKTRALAAVLRARGDAARGRPAAAVGDVAAEIEWAKARLLGPDVYASAARAAGRRPPLAFDEIADVYREYEINKRKRRSYDFDDLLRACADAIVADPTFAAVQHWRYRHVFVDEFQDATPLQLRLLQAWVGETPDLCVVGDASQAIYGFAGADATPLLDFAGTFTGSETVALDRNYRSTPQVVAVAETALGREPAAGRPAVIAVRSGGPTPTVRAYADDSAEAVSTAQRCWEAFASGVPWHRIAVLFRTNAQTSLFEAALARRGIPCRTGMGRRFVERPAVRGLLDELREAERESPRRAFADLLADLGDEPRAAPEPEPEPEIDDVGAIDDEGASLIGAAPQTRREHCDALLRLGRDYQASETVGGSVSGFVSWLDATTRGERTDGPAVDLLTFHRAKGLEWQVVFVTGLEVGLVPTSWASSTAALAEERRLLHVALGRAEQVLHVSWARERTINGRRSRREPSPWLDAIAARAARVAPRPVDPLVAISEVRETLARAVPPAPVPRVYRRS